MNRKLLYLTFALAALCITGAYAQSAGTVAVKAQQAQKQGDNIALSFDIVFDGYTLHTQQQVILTPVIESPSGERRELLPVVVNGKRRGNIEERVDRLGRRYTRPVYRTVNMDREPLTTTVNYQARTGYGEWMDGSTVYLRTDVCGCAGDPVDSYDISRWRLPEMPRYTYTYTPHVAFVAPPREDPKIRVESGSAFINYRVNDAVVLPDHNGNRAELDRIRQSIEYVRDEPTAQISSIEIAAFASPEGSERHNNDLSARRARSLRDYITRNFRVPSELMKYEGRGEDWDSLATFVDNDPGVPRRSEVLQIINGNESPDAREARLKRLADGGPYRYLLSHTFPRLRRSDYRINYSVPEFTVEKGKELLRLKPDMLSQKELYHIANTYRRGSAEFIEVFETALRLYPDDVYANNNVAATEIMKGDTGAALERLEPLAAHPEVWNNLGVALMWAGRFDEAESYLIKARDNGSAEAGQNLSILPDLRKAVTEYEMGKNAYDRYRGL